MKHAQRRTMHTVAALLAATVALAQWEFRLDTTFRTNIPEKNVNHMHFLEDGRIFLSGLVRFTGDWFDRGGTCLLPLGELDTTFPTFPLTTGGGKIVPWLDGKFYVGTRTVRRVAPDGLIDTSFIALYTSPYFSTHVDGDFHMYPDGSILISGAHLLSDSARGFVGYYNLIWFSNQGYLDTTRTHRKSNYPYGPCSIYYFSELANGQFICSGTCTEFEGAEVDWIFRVHADGTPDTTFRSGVFHGAAQTYLPLADGRVYAGGNFKSSQAPGDTLYLVRFLPDGSLDPTFNMPQLAMGGQGLTVSYGPSIYRIFPWKPGYLLVTGKFRYVNGEPRHSICLIDSTGQLMPAFAGHWLGTTTDGSVTYSSINDVLPNADTSAIYICGAYTGYGDGELTDPGQRFVTRLLVEESTTGVQEHRPEATALRLHPNPATGQVAISYHLPRHTGAVALVVRDAAGRVLHRYATRGQQGRHSWDTRGLAPGLYLVELHGDGGVERTERLVVQR